MKKIILSLALLFSIQSVVFSMPCFSKKIDNPDACVKENTQNSSCDYMLNDKLNRIENAVNDVKSGISSIKTHWYVYWGLTVANVLFLVAVGVAGSMSVANTK